MGRKPVKLALKLKFMLKMSVRNLLYFFEGRNPCRYFLCFLVFLSLSLFNAMSCSDPRDDDCYSGRILCMIVSKIVFPVSMELKHRSDYAGPNFRSTAWIVYISMIKADSPKTISLFIFPFLFPPPNSRTVIP